MITYSGMKPKLKDLAGNVSLRLAISKEARESPAARQWWQKAFADDILLWINLCCWTFDPRKQGLEKIPFITWEFQDASIRKIQECLGTEDLLIEKSRDMGASWMCLMAIMHSWQFFKDKTFLIVSRNEHLVEKPGDPDTLFWKLDFLLKTQPRWLVPDHTRLKLHLENRFLGSTIDGASTTGDVGRGGRRTAIMLDEFAAFDTSDGYAALAATGGNTRSRIFNSTPKGSVGAFYDQAHNPHVQRLTLHWTEHPEKVEGKYTDASGKARSPWYDRECRRLPVPALIAQELDIDYAGSNSPFFDPSVIGPIIDKDSRAPILKGRMIFTDPNEPTFVPADDGDLLLWVNLDPDGKVPPNESFCIGIDVSAGSGATNSVLSVADRRTREKVGELATPRLSPDRFADMVLSVARLFNSAFLIWESNGPGGIFGRQIVSRGYRNFYYRQDEQGLKRKLHDKIIPGWASSRENKDLLFRAYLQALSTGTYINRSRVALEECRDYIYFPDGSIGNNRSRSPLDPSGARQNHGDRPTADALAVKALGDQDDIKTEPEVYSLERLPPNPQYGSWAWRRKQAEEQDPLTTWGTSQGMQWYTSQAW